MKKKKAEKNLKFNANKVFDEIANILLVHFNLWPENSLRSIKDLGGCLVLWAAMLTAATQVTSPMTLAVG